MFPEVGVAKTARLPSAVLKVKGLSHCFGVAKAARLTTANLKYGFYVTLH